MWLLLLGTRPLGLHAPWSPCDPLAPLKKTPQPTPPMSAILLLPNALCYFLIITQVTCK